MTDRYENIRKALEGLRERCAQEAERITARRRAVAAMTNNEAVKPCGVAAAIRKIDVQQYCECAVREIERLRTENERLREDTARYRWLREREIPEWLDLWHQNPDRIDAAIDRARGKEVQS